MKPNNFIDTTVDDYYLNPYKFTKKNNIIVSDNKIINSNSNSNSNLNYIIKTLTSIIMNNGGLMNKHDEFVNFNNNNCDNDNHNHNHNDNIDKLIIFKFVVNNNIDKLIKTLDNNSYDINIQDNDGDTALHIAIFLSNYNACKILIQYDADIYIKDKWGQIPLHRLCFALENKNAIKIIEVINQKYSNNKDKIFNNIDKFNNTPLHLVIKYILKNKIKLNKNILLVLHTLINLTDIEITNNEGLSSKDLLNMLDISK